MSSERGNGMRYVLAIFLPPIAVLFTRGIWAFILNVLLLFIMLLPAIIHALYVVHNHYQVRREARFLRQLKGALK